MSDGCVAAISGDAAGGYILFDWYEAGADMKAMPESQKGEDWAHLIVAGPEGCRFMFREPVWIAVEGPYMAWGCGLEAAMAAMEMGADAKRAVEVASKLCGGCGLGVDVFEVKSTEEAHEDLPKPQDR